MTQFYRPKLMQAHHVRMESRTRGTLPAGVADHLPALLGSEGGSRRSQSARCSSLPHRCPVAVSFYFLASKLIRLQFWSQQHADEETPLFAHYASRWATRNDPDQHERFWL